MFHYTTETRHGGTLGLRSEQGKGTLFFIMLPLDK